MASEADDSSPAASESQSLVHQKAFDLTLSAATALRKEELIPVNIDVASAVATAGAALSRIMDLRDEASRLPRFDISHFDQLRVYIFALSHAHANLIAASVPPEPITALNERAVKLRDTMYLDAVALARRGLISGEQITGFKANVGYKNLAADLLGLDALLRANWHKIASRTGVQLTELDEAVRLGKQLMAAVTAREQASGLIARAQAQRQRTFTLFVRAYDQVRRAISYLRWDDGDLDQICPSLFAGRGGSRRKERPPSPASGARRTASVATHSTTPEPTTAESTAAHSERR